jgi:hypothetical protein
LDDYIAAAQNLLVVAAKQSDLGKGFTQLAGELMSLRDADRLPRFPTFSLQCCDRRPQDLRVLIHTEISLLQR